MRNVVFILLSISLSVLSVVVFAQGVPTSFTYQGKVTDALGQPLPDGSNAMRFKLFNAETGGSLLWDSGAMNVGVKNGVFSVVLGASPTPPVTSSVLSSDAIWLEVTVGTGSPLPRTKLSSAPFALRAGDLGMPFSKTVSSSPSFTPAFEVKNTTANYAIRGGANNASFAGVMGANTGSGFGVYGHSQSGMGVRGYQQDIGNLGVLAGPSYGVLGSSGGGYGVWGSSTSGFAGYFEGNVSVKNPGKLGIGLDNPNRKLYVVENKSGLSYPLKLDNPHSTIGTDATGILFSVAGDGGNNLQTERGKGGLVYQLTNTWNRGSFHFLQNSTADSSVPTLSNAVLTIANDGKVGVGTTSPSAKLDVTETIRIQGTNWPASGEGLELGYDSTTDVATIQSRNRTAGTVGKLYLGSGNVGIGQSDPVAKLDVVGDVKISGAIRGNYGSGGGPFPHPAYDTGWVKLPPGSVGLFWHLLGGSVDDYVVDLVVRNGYASADPTNHRVGGDTFYKDSAFQEYGVYWANLNTNSVTVVHEFADSQDAWVRLRMWVCK